MRRASSLEDTLEVILEDTPRKKKSGFGSTILVKTNKNMDSVGLLHFDTTL
jgi:hypothetical protein